MKSTVYERFSVTRLEVFLGLSNWQRAKRLCVGDLKDKRPATGRAGRLLYLYCRGRVKRLDPKGLLQAVWVAFRSFEVLSLEGGVPVDDRPTSNHRELRMIEGI